MKKKRHNYTPEEKVYILKRHLVEHVAVSDLCDEYKLQPKVFYDWQKQFFENGSAAFIRKKGIAGKRLINTSRSRKTSLDGSTKFCLN